MTLYPRGVACLCSKQGPAYAGAMSAATATIGPIIPPSILMVVYAISDSRVTVAGLFLAGIVPGILLGLALMGVNHWISIKKIYSQQKWRI